MLPWGDGEGEAPDEHVAVGRDDGDVDEFDVVALSDFATAAEHGGVGGDAGGTDEFLLEVACGNVVHDVEEAGDAGGVACEFGDFFVREHDAPEGVGAGEEDAPIRYEGFGVVGGGFEEVILARDFEEDGHGAEDEAEGAPEIFDNEILHQAVIEASTKNAVDMFD